LSRKLFSDCLVGLLQNLPVELVIFLVFEYGDPFFEFVGQNVEQTVADLSLGYERYDVIDLELSSGELVVHLLNDLLEFLGQLLALLEVEDLLLVFI